MNDLQDTVLFYVDTGNYIRNLVKEVSNDHKEIAKETILNEINEMINKGILTKGKLHTQDAWVVVTEWMPNTAKRLKEER